MKEKNGKIVGVKRGISKNGKSYMIASIVFTDPEDENQLGDKVSTLFVSEEITKSMKAEDMVGKKIKVDGRYGKGENGQAVWYQFIKSFVM